MNSALVTWEAEYWSGTVLRENQGGLYAEIDRDQLAAFRLVAPGEILIELRVKPGANGHGFVYRRRTLMPSGQPKQVWYVLGMIPNGPVMAFNPETDSVLKADRFESGAGPLGKPDPLPFERWANSSHSTDALVRASRVRTPSGYVLNV